MTILTKCRRHYLFVAPTQLPVFPVGIPFSAAKGECPSADDEVF
ncbi:MAG: hypothetical protein WCU80_01375 [Paludibacteraceae bacterium]